MSEPAPDRPADRTSDSTETREQIDPAAVFDALASSRRLALLRTLCAADGSVSLATAARRIPRHERELAPDGDSSSPSKIRLTLRHVHIEKLRAAGLVAFDDVNGGLRLTADPDRIVDLVDTAIGVESDR